MIDYLAATPLDRVVEHAESASDALVGGGMMALVVALLLGVLDGVDRGTIRSTMDGATDAFKKAAESTNGAPIAGAVEFVRAVAGPAETFFRRSRAVVPLVVAGVLFVASALVPLFETALVANHCGGKVVGAEATAEPDPTPANTASPPGDDGTAGSEVGTVTTEPPKRDKDPGKNAAGGKDPAYPRVFYPPECEDGEGDSPE